MLVTAPPKYLPVLMGRGAFLKDPFGNNVWTQDGEPVHTVYSGSDVLAVMPAHHPQQTWPLHPSDRGLPRDLVPVFLCVTTNTDCQNDNLVTEIGFTIFDLDSIYTGNTPQRPRGRSPPDMPVGDRGENMARFAMTDHYIVTDTADHHPGTCRSPGHTAQPYHFTYRKSKRIPRRDIPSTLENILRMAGTIGVSAEGTQQGLHRGVILVSLGGDASIHPTVRRVLQPRENELFRHWDLSQYHLIAKYCRDPTYHHCLNRFGIQYHADNKDVSNNAGNRSAFTIQLLIAVCFLSEAQVHMLDAGHSLVPNPRFPGVPSALARDNRPPEAGPLPEGWVPVEH